MNTLQIAYRILQSLETGKRADYMGKLIGPQKLGVSEEKWLEVMQMLIDEEYISGARIFEDIVGETNVDIEKVHITLKGAEYLHENSTMKKIAKIATNVIGIVQK